MAWSVRGMKGAALTLRSCRWALGSFLSSEPEGNLEIIECVLHMRGDRFVFVERITRRMLSRREVLGTSNLPQQGGAMPCLTTSPFSRQHLSVARTSLLYQGPSHSTQPRKLNFRYLSIESNSRSATDMDDQHRLVERLPLEHGLTGPRTEIFI
ncbi:hypothetical protein EDB83DRAFT_717035 [Lactarius deliciosus]|nr:hypothetical protein EDB83DRAFT_717035 [Lactarius deliciosus]